MIVDDIRNGSPSSQNGGRVGGVGETSRQYVSAIAIERQLSAVPGNGGEVGPALVV